jgi:hypothetical protein
VQFYDPRNLRAACRQHNLARGFAAQLEQPAGTIVRKDYT